MILSSLTHGERFKISSTGEKGLLIGMYGDSNTLVVVIGDSPRLTNRPSQTEVEQL